MNNVMHLLVSGGYGGIEILARNYSSRSEHNNTFVFVLRGGEITEQIRNAGVSVYILNGTTRRPLFLLDQLRKIIRKQRIDTIVVHHDSPLLHFLARIIKIEMNRRVQIISYVHCNPEDYLRTGGLGAKIRNSIITNSFRNADKVVAISEFVKNKACDVFGVSKSKIFTIYNGVDVAKFENDNHHHDLHNWLYVGRLERVKGVQVIIKALAALPQDLDYQFNIIGDGPYREELERLANDYDIKDKVRFWGMQDDVASFMKKAGFFLFTPIWEEGFGISVVEAMASGLICICARSGALSEILLDSETGFLVNKGSAEELAEKIRFALQLPESRLERIRLSAIDKSKEFDIDSYVIKFDEFIAN